MVRKYEAPTFTDLLAEQEVVQASKFQGRTLDEYDRCFFPGQDWLEPRSSSVTDFLRPLCTSERISLEGVIRGLEATKGEKLVNWVDMGAGRGLAMRQMAANKITRKNVDMTAVDLFNLGTEGLTPEELAYLEDSVPGITAETAAPRLIQADIETVLLSKPADVITSVEAIQYMNNPIAAICNWYNQLADNGLLFIATEHDWAGWIRYHQDSGMYRHDEGPTRHMFEALQSSQVGFAASAESDWENGYRPAFDPDRIRSMVIQKRTGTQLKVNSQIMEVWVNPHDYKAAYYNRPTLDASPIIEVV